MEYTTGMPSVLDDILAILADRIGAQLRKDLHRMSAQLDALTAQVAANNTVIGSALALIQGLAAQLAAAGTDPTKLADLAASLKANDDALAAAVAANTPAAPPATT